MPLSLTQAGPLTSKGISLFDVRTCSHSLFNAPLTLRQHNAMQKLRNLTPHHAEDKILWTISSCGSFTVKSVYRILSQGEKTRSSVTSLWRTKVTPSMKCFFLLLFLNNRILTHDVMQRRNLPHTQGCVMRLDWPSETANHLFLNCAFARQVWSAISTHIGYQVVRFGESILHTYITSQPSDKLLRKKWRTLFITATWILWKERNGRAFRRNSALASFLALKILQEADLCSTYC